MTARSSRVDHNDWVVQTTGKSLFSLGFSSGWTSDGFRRLPSSTAGLHPTRGAPARSCDQDATPHRTGTPRHGNRYVGLCRQDSWAAHVPGTHSHRVAVTTGTRTDQLHPGWPRRLLGGPQTGLDRDRRGDRSGRLSRTRVTPLSRTSLPRSLLCRADAARRARGGLGHTGEVPVVHHDTMRRLADRMPWRSPRPTIAQRLDKQRERWRELAAARVVEVIPREGCAPIGEDACELAFRDEGLHQVLHHEGQAESR